MSRRWPGSSSGSDSTRRLAASTAPRVSPTDSRASANRSRRSATVRSTRTARAACQSSKAGLSRRAKPARNGPRASAAARSRSGESHRRLEPFDLREIDRHPIRVQGDAGSIDEQPTVADRAPQGRQRPAERAAGRFVVGVRPEHRRQLVARERTALGGHQGDDGHRLAGVDDDRPAGHLDLERSEESDRQRWGGPSHRVTVLDARPIP